MYRQTTDIVVESLQRAKPDILIAGAGGLQISDVIRRCPSLAQVVWVAPRGSRHMEWNEVPEGIGGRVGISVWHEIVDEKKDVAGTQLPAISQGEVVPGITTFWPTQEDLVGQMIEFSQKASVPKPIIEFTF